MFHLRSRQKNFSHFPTRQKNKKLIWFLVEHEPLSHSSTHLLTFYFSTTTNKWWQPSKQNKIKIKFLERRAGMMREFSEIFSWKPLWPSNNPNLSLGMKQTGLDLFVFSETKRPILHLIIQDFSFGSSEKRSLMSSYTFLERAKIGLNRHHK